MSSKAQRRVFVGREDPPGTGVTVDVALRAVASLKAVVDKQTPEEDVGSFAPARHYIGSAHAEGNLEVDGIYEQFPIPVAMAMGEGEVAGSDPYIWTHTLPDGTPDDFATFSMEYTDGVDHHVRAEDVFATALEISGEAGKTWMVKPEVTGGAVSFPAAPTAYPALGSATPIRMADTTLSIDDAWANLGVTTVPATLISFTWKLENLQHNKMFAGSLYPSGRGNDRWKTTLEIIAEMGRVKIESEKDKLFTTGQSAVRIKALSANAGGAGVDYSAQIGGMYFLKEVNELDDRDGNSTIKLIYQGEKDSSGNTAQIVTYTSLAAL